MKLQAVIFDFDGIVVDSEPLHHQAFCRVLDPLGLPLTWERYHEHYLGFDDRDVFRERFREAGRALDDVMLRKLMAEKAFAFVAILEADGVTPYTGVVHLVRELSKHVPLAICSGALSSDIDPILRILSITSCFSVMVTADQVKVSKPDPESYRMAFTRLCEQFPGRVSDPSRCIAIEDTPAGIKAASGAGLKVLAITNTYKADTLTQAANVSGSLEHVDAAFLDGMIG